MRENIFIYAFLFLTSTLFTFCGTTEQMPQGKLPPSKTQTPRYETDEALEQKIVTLETKLINHPEDTNLLLQIASLHHELDQKEKALTYLEKMRDLGFSDEPRVYGTMGSIYRDLGAFAKAKESYITFKELLPPDSRTASKVAEEIQELEFIITSMESPYVINPRPFGNQINTNNSEYLPQFTMDDSMFIFTRRFFNQEDLFTATLTADGYKTEAIEELNTTGNEGAHTISADGQLLIFTKCLPKQGFGSCDLYRSRKLPSGKWSNPSNMGQRINSRNWDAQPSLSPDGRTLYFASKRDGGHGGSDIYVSKLRRDGKWSVPKNLGTAINTVKNDESPFIHADGRTLYFRSKGYIGHGDYDIYKSSKSDNGWNKVVNLGYPINSTGNDGALVVSLDGTSGYYATDVQNGQKLDHLDLLKFDLPLEFRPQPMTFVKGRVIDEDNRLPLPAEIRIASIENDEYRAYYTANHNGEFLAAIPVGTPVLINISKKEYLFFSDHYYYEEVKYSVDPYYLDVALSKAKAEDITTEPEPIILQNIFFESGEATLLSQSDSEILILYGLLVDEPSIKIQITGHTDDVGSESDNLALSQARADAVREALIAKGIDEDRITAVGKGESEPIADNTSEEGRAQNRRTEFLVIQG